MYYLVRMELYKQKLDIIIPKNELEQRTPFGAVMKAKQVLMENIQFRDIISMTQHELDEFKRQSND